MFGQSCLCVTFSSLSTPSFGMLLLKLSNRNTHMCTSSIRMISFFYPSVWIVHKLECFKYIMPALCPFGQGEEGGQPNVDRPRHGGVGGGPKNSQICMDILYGWPLRGKKCCWLVYAKHLPVVLSLFPSAVRI